MESLPSEPPRARRGNDRVFDAAWAYDLAFAWDLERELDVLMALAGLDTRPAARVLVPACGTGRYALALAERGFTVLASDINAAMLAVAARKRPHPAVSYALADMTQRPRDARADCDAAFTLCNSFRYILGDDEIAGHLEAMHARLRPGATYVIELALNVDASHVGGRHGWAVVHDDCRVLACWTLLSVTPPLSLEQAALVVEADGGAVHEFREQQPQRLWTAPELEVAATRAGLALTGIFAPDGRRAADAGRPGRYYAALRRPAPSPEGVTR